MFRGIAEPVPTLEDIVQESERYNPRKVGQVVEKFGIDENDLVGHLNDSLKFRTPLCSDVAVLTEHKRSNLLT